MVTIPYTPSHVTFWSSGLVTNVRPYICTSAIPMATKLERVVTCDGGTTTSRLCDLLIMWSREKWKKNYIWISTIPMATKPGRMVTYSQKTPHTKLHLITWPRNKYKTLYLHFWSTYDHKNPTFKVTWPFHDVVKW